MAKLSDIRRDPTEDGSTAGRLHEAVLRAADETRRIEESLRFPLEFEKIARMAALTAGVEDAVREAQKFADIARPVRELEDIARSVRQFESPFRDIEKAVQAASPTFPVDLGPDVLRDRHLLPPTHLASPSVADRRHERLEQAITDLAVGIEGVQRAVVEVADRDLQYAREREERAREDADAMRSDIRGLGATVQSLADKQEAQEKSRARREMFTRWAELLASAIIGAVMARLL